MKKIVAVLLTLVLVFSLSVCAMADALSDIQAKGELIVGASVAFPPYEFYFTNPETGVEEYAGFDMALAQGIADLLGVKLTIADQSFAGLITALRSGDIDMIISGMAIREDRLEVVDFTQPYFTGSQILMVRAADYDTYTTVESLAGKTVCAQMGSLQAGILEEQFAACDAQVMDSIPLMVLDLLQGSAEGLLLTDTVALSYMALHPGELCISQVPVEYNGAGAGVAVAKGDNESLLALVNEYIDQILADGTFDGWLAVATEQNAQLLAAAEAE